MKVKKHDQSPYQNFIVTITLTKILTLANFLQGAPSIRSQRHNTYMYLVA